MRRNIFLLLILGFIFRILLFPYGTHPSDMGLWRYWSEAIVRLGFPGFFEKIGWTDYLPFYFYPLFLIRKIYLFLIPVFPTVSFEALLKLPATIADIITAFFLFQLLKDFGEKKALVLVFSYLFNPAIFGNSAMWGQVDGVGAMILVLALYAFLKGSYFWTGALSGLAFTFKPNMVVLLPILVFAPFLEKKIKNLTKFSLGTIVSIFLITFPFTFPDPLKIPGLLIERYLKSLNQYPYTSVNAFNFWAIGNRWWRTDLSHSLGLTLHDWGILLVAASFILSLLFLLLKWTKEDLKDKFKVLILSLATLFLVLFTFATRVHERHLFNVFPLLLILAAAQKKFYWSYLILSLTYSLNLYFAWYWIISGGKFAFGWSVINALSLTNTLLTFTFIIYLCLQIKRYFYS